MRATYLIRYRILKPPNPKEQAQALTSLRLGIDSLWSSHNKPLLRIVEQALHNFKRTISDGTSPSHGADRDGPTAVIKSLGKMDQIKSGGTLLNQKFLPSVLEKEEDLTKLMHLIRSYFKLNGHHIQFNIADSETLQRAQKSPAEYRDLLVRVAGYSDYFVDLDQSIQQEIIDRTTHGSF